MPAKGMAAKAAEAAPAARGPTKRAAAATAAAETEVQPPAKRHRSQAAVPHCARSGGTVQARPRGSKSQHEAAAAVIEEDGIGDDSQHSEDGNGESPDYSNQPVSVLREMCRQLWAWTTAAGRQSFYNGLRCTTNRAVRAVTAAVTAAVAAAAKTATTVMANQLQHAGQTALPAGAKQPCQHTQS